MAAPIGSQVLGEVLPYLEVEKDNQTEEETKKEVEIPNVVGMTVTDAKKELERARFGYRIRRNRRRYFTKNCNKTNSGKWSRSL